jgi:hypothetical protein
MGLGRIPRQFQGNRPAISMNWIEIAGHLLALPGFRKLTNGLHEFFTGVKDLVGKGRGKAP